MENDAYNSIYYDKYRHVYYRFASLGIDLKAKRPLDHVLYKPVSVIILDEKFNKIGETKLPKNRYYFPNSFVGKEGLYISNSHPDNKQFSESNLSFSCYKLIENQNEKR